MVNNMKKLLIIVFFIIFPMFVYADSCDIENISVSNITLSNKTEGVIEKSKPVINGKSITLDLSMSEINDKVEYKLTVYNKSNEDYELNNLSVNSEYIDYKIETSDNNNKIKSKSEKEIYLIIEYKNEVPEESFVNNKYNDYKNLVISLSNEEESIINPKTGYNILFFIFLALASILFLILINKKESIKLFLIFTILLTPLAVKSLCKIDIGFTSNIEIKESKKIYLMGNNSTTFLRTNVLKADVEKITFVNSIGEHKLSDENCFDVSRDEDGSVLAWVTDTDSNSKYEVAIGSDSKIYLSNGKMLFSALTGVTSITGFDNVDTSKVTDMTFMFNQCSNLTSLDLSSFNTTNVDSFTGMFLYCKSLVSLNLSNFDTSNATKMSRMFSHCSSLTSLDLSSFNTSNVKSMSIMFSGCSSLTNLDLSNFDTSKATSMSYMFDDCSNLTSLDLSSFNTSNVKSMSEMFANCSSLTSLDLSSFDTSNVTDMGWMFDDCLKLISLDLSSFNTSKVTTMKAMFQNCNNLISLNVSSFDTSSVTDMGWMFAFCNNLKELDVTSFDTSKVTDMTQMFYSLASITSLDVSSFDTSNVTSMGYMFNRCWSIKTIYASEKFVTTKVENSIYMFLHDEYLVGGAGTTFGGPDKSNHEYAHIDGGVDNPGYFTLKSDEG